MATLERRRSLAVPALTRAARELAIPVRPQPNGVTIMVNDTSPKVEVDDVIVLLLGAPSKARALQDRIEGITRLEKLIFLLKQETPIGEQLTEDPEFESHNFGPFSAKVYQAVDVLVSAELLQDSAELSPSTEDTWEIEEVVGTVQANPYATRNFRLTERGRKYYEALIRDLPRDTESNLADFKARFGGLRLRQLIRYVYKKYPKFTDKSIIREEVLK